MIARISAVCPSDACARPMRGGVDEGAGTTARQGSPSAVDLSGHGISIGSGAASNGQEPAMMQYELRAEHRPTPGGGRRVHRWHVVRAGEESGLCGHRLLPTAERARIADLEDLAGRRCEACRTAYRAALPPPD